MSPPSEDERGGRLEKEQRLVLGRHAAELRGVLAVVLADARRSSTAGAAPRANRTGSRSRLPGLLEELPGVDLARVARQAHARDGSLSSRELDRKVDAALRVADDRRDGQALAAATIAAATTPDPHASVSPSTPRSQVRICDAFVRPPDEVDVGALGKGRVPAQRRRQAIDRRACARSPRRRRRDAARRRTSESP